MFRSLSSRIAGLGAIVGLALFALVGLLIDASIQTQRSFHWVNHTAEVIETIGDGLAALRDAESGQRGFLLTHDAGFAKSFEERIAVSQRDMRRVVELTSDNPVQNPRAREIQELVDKRVAVLRGPLALGRRGAFDAARQSSADGRGLGLMAAVTAHANVFLGEERRLQAMRIGAAGRRLAWVKQLALIGGPVIALLIGLISMLIIRGIRRPLNLIRQAMSELGEGERHTRITSAMGSREFTSLADGYNAMADRLEAAVTDQVRSEHQLQIANEELQSNGDMLRERSDVIELLGGMAHRMQAARTDAELAQIIDVFVPRVLPDSCGALYAHNNSRNLLVPVAGWGGFDPGLEGFAPDQCWALRRGQSHFVLAPGCDIVCGHVHDEQAIYHCEPLLAGGEVIGVLYLRGKVGTENRFTLTVLAENIASALVNHRLQRDLREQTIRDPLTGLFNRRYMEEALVIEIARASRSGVPLSLVMCDVDHFKRFNDDFGHDAGDVVLQAAAGELRSHLRDGDLVCRFGGEEFTIIAPGTTATALADRIELVRRAIADLAVRHNGQTLGSTSMSFGIATWTQGMSRDGSALVQAADAALYRAKREGRNRAVIDVREAA